MSISAKDRLLQQRQIELDAMQPFSPLVSAVHMHGYAFSAQGATDAGDSFHLTFLPRDCTTRYENRKATTLSEKQQPSPLAYMQPDSHQRQVPCGPAHSIVGATLH